MTPSVSSQTHVHRTRRLVVAALLAALLAASAWITVPLGTVPITLQTFVVVLIAMVLRPGWAGAAIGVYLLLGAAGVPVFAGPRGGLGVLAGPTGGFLYGFIVGGVAGAALRGALSARSAHSSLADAAGAAVALALVYLIGWAHLAFVTGMGATPAFAAGVAPFVLLDLAKGAAALVVARSLRRAGVVE